MLATSKNVLFPGHNHLLIKVSGHQYHWLAGGYDLEIGTFGVRSGFFCPVVMMKPTKYGTVFDNHFAPSETKW